MRSTKLFRLIKGKSQFEVSLATEIPNYRLSLIENGKKEPTEAELSSLAAALGTSVDLLRGEVCEEQLSAVQK
jgi:transcriptional regulator with XRE-family HTH domain